LFLNPSNGLKHRFFSPNPKIIGGFSLTNNGLVNLNSSTLKANVFDKKDKCLFICKAEAASAGVGSGGGDGETVFDESETEKPKFLVLRLYLF
jgi:hypothetical protein